MPDGIELVIPPGALVKSGTVTLFIFPTQEMRPEPGRELIGPGYEIWAIDGKGQQIVEFNKNIVMTMGYDETQLQKLGLSEQMLIPVYYSTLLGHWTLADSYVVDTEHNEISLHLRHFTTFGLASTERGQRRVYLPVVLRNLD
jgi:hypothetical protein